MRFLTIGAGSHFLAGIIKRGSTATPHIITEASSPGFPRSMISRRENRLARPLQHLEMSSAHVLPRSEMPTEFSSFGAAWKANDALGGVKIFLPRPGLTGLEIASDLIGADSQTCKGKFAPARSSELVDSDVVFRAFFFMCGQRE
jgi:hypothetical protein